MDTELPGDIGGSSGKLKSLTDDILLVVFLYNIYQLKNTVIGLVALDRRQHKLKVNTIFPLITANYHSMN